MRKAAASTGSSTLSEPVPMHLPGSNALQIIPRFGDIAAIYNY